MRLSITCAAAILLGALSAVALPHVQATPPPPPQYHPPVVTTSRLASLDHNELIATAIDELIGKNNGPRVLAGHTAPSVVVLLTAADQKYLVRHVFGPYLWDADKREPLDRAACQRYLRQAQINWTRTIGEALEERVCDFRLEAKDLFTNPAVKLALADELLLGYPRRKELLNEVRMSIAETAGSTPHEVCYGLLPTDPATLDDPLCQIEWADSGPDAPFRVAAFYYQPRPLNQWSPGQIVDAWSALTGMTTKAANARVAQLRQAFKARIARRDATVEDERSHAPAIVSQIDVAHSLSRNLVYLWHMKCSEPKSILVAGATGAVRADSVCLTVAYAEPRKGGCFEDSYSFIKMPGAAGYTRGDPIAPEHPIRCP